MHRRMRCACWSVSRSAIQGSIKMCVQLFPPLTCVGFVFPATVHHDLIQLVTTHPLGLRRLIAEGTALGWRCRQQPGFRCIRGQRHHRMRGRKPRPFLAGMNAALLSCARLSVCLGTPPSGGANGLHTVPSQLDIREVPGRNRCRGKMSTVRTFVLHPRQGWSLPGRCHSSRRGHPSG